MLNNDKREFYNITGNRSSTTCDKRKIYRDEYVLFRPNKITVPGTIANQDLLIMYIAIPNLGYKDKHCFRAYVYQTINFKQIGFVCFPYSIVLLPFTRIL